MKTFYRKIRIGVFILLIISSVILLNGCFNKDEALENETPDGEYTSLSKADETGLHSAIASYLKIGGYEQLSVRSEDVEKTREVHKKWGAESNVAEHFSVKYQKEEDDHQVSINILKYPTKGDAMKFLESLESSAKSGFKKNNENAEGKEENGSVTYKTERKGVGETTKFIKKVENGVTTFTNRFDLDDGFSFYRKTYCKKNFCFQVTEGKTEEDSHEEYSKLLADVDKIVFTFTKKM